MMKWQYYVAKMAWQDGLCGTDWKDDYVGYGATL